MALFKEVHCAHCGSKTGVLSRTYLKEDVCICSKCAGVAPSYIRGYLDRYTYEEFQELRTYVEEENPRLAKQFKQTHSYHGLHLDTVHKLFYFDTGLFGKSLYFKLENVQNLEMTFQAEKLEKGILSDKVTGEVKLLLEMMSPQFVYSTTLATGEKASAKENFFGTKVTYQNPKAMDAFLETFYTYENIAHREALEQIQRDFQERMYAEAAEAEQAYGYETPVDTRLQQAMALFMIDDLSQTSRAQIKSQRNRLIKSFHPDTNSADDTRYAQKINEAYEVLCANVRE